MSREYHMPHMSPLGRGHTALRVLSIGLFVGALVSPLGNPVSAAGTTSSVRFFLSEPGVEGPSLAGTTIESFSAYDGVSAVSPTAISAPTGLSIGSVSAGLMNAALSDVGASVTSGVVQPWNRGAGSGIGYVNANGSVTMNLSSPRNYLGFLWLAGDSTNTIVLRSSGSEIARFSTRDIISLVPKTAGTVTAIGGATYTKTDYYGSRYRANSSCGAPCNEPYAFIHLVAPSSVTFDQVQFVQGNSGGFEFDNIAVATYSGTFDTTGLVGVPGDELSNDTFSVTESASLESSVATNDTILSGSTFSLVSNPDLGSITLSPDGSFTFEAGAISGTTTFEYRVCRPSPSTTCVTASVTVTIEAAETTTSTQGASASAPPSNSEAHTARPEGLPATGTSSSSTALASLVLVLIGVASVTFSRRRLVHMS